MPKKLTIETSVTNPCSLIQSVSFVYQLLDYGEKFINEGDEIEVYLEKLESNYGNLVLSKDKAEILKAWDRILFINTNKK